MLYLGPIYPRKVGLFVIPNFLTPLTKAKALKHKQPNMQSCKPFLTRNKDFCTVDKPKFRNQLFKCNEKVDGRNNTRDN